MAIVACGVYFLNDWVNCSWMMPNTPNTVMKPRVRTLPTFSARATLRHADCTPVSSPRKYDR